MLQQCEVIKITKYGCVFFKTIIDYDVCWNYIGPSYLIKGYPVIQRLNKNWVASRFSWFCFTGRDYYGKEVHHKCKNRLCINPLHLEELTAKKHRCIHNKERNK